MKKILSALITYNSLIFGTSACIEINPISPRADPSCQAPSIEKNIIGTWHFESSRNTTNVGISGTITFGIDGNISDPDSLFQNTLDGYRVTSKKYNAKVDRKYPNFSGYVFEVYQNNKLGKYTTYFTTVNNECSRIHLRVLFSNDSDDSFILTR